MLYNLIKIEVRWKAIPYICIYMVVTTAATLTPSRGFREGGGVD